MSLAYPQNLKLQLFFFLISVFTQPLSTFPKKSKRFSEQTTNQQSSSSSTESKDKPKNEVKSFFSEEQKNIASEEKTQMILDRILKDDSWLFNSFQRENNFFLTDPSKDWLILSHAVKQLNDVGASFSAISESIFLAIAKESNSLNDEIPNETYLSAFNFAEITSHILLANLQFPTETLPSTLTKARKSFSKEDHESIFDFDKCYQIKIENDVKYLKFVTVFLAAKCIDILAPALKLISKGKKGSKLFYYEKTLNKEQCCFYSKLAVNMANCEEQGSLILSVFDTSWLLLRCPEFRSIIENETNDERAFRFLQKITETFFLLRCHLFKDKIYNEKERKDLEETTIFRIMKNVNFFYNQLVNEDHHTENVFYVNDCHSWINAFFDKFFEPFEEQKKSFYDFIMFYVKNLNKCSKKEILKHIIKENSACLEKSSKKVTLANIAKPSAHLLAPQKTDSFYTIQKFLGCQKDSSIFLHNPLEKKYSTNKISYFDSLLADTRGILNNFAELSDKTIMNSSNFYQSNIEKLDKEQHQYLQLFPDFIYRKNAILNNLLTQKHKAFESALCFLADESLNKNLNLTQTCVSSLHAVSNDILITFFIPFLQKNLNFSFDISFTNSFIREILKILNDNENKKYSIKAKNPDKILFEEASINFLANLHLVFCLCNNPSVFSSSLPTHPTTKEIAGCFDVLKNMFQVFLKSHIAFSSQKTNKAFLTSTEIRYLKKQENNPKHFFNKFEKLAQSFFNDNNCLALDNDNYNQLFSLFGNYSYWNKFMSLKDQVSTSYTQSPLEQTQNKEEKTAPEKLMVMIPQSQTVVLKDAPQQHTLSFKALKNDYVVLKKQGLCANYLKGSCKIESTEKPEETTNKLEQKKLIPKKKQKKCLKPQNKQRQIYQSQFNKIRQLYRLWKAKKKDYQIQEQLAKAQEKIRTKQEEINNLTERLGETKTKATALQNRFSKQTLDFMIVSNQLKTRQKKQDISEQITKLKEELKILNEKLFLANQELTQLKLRASEKAYQSSQAQNNADKEKKVVLQKISELETKITSLKAENSILQNELDEKKKEKIPTLKESSSVGISTNETQLHPILSYPVLGKFIKSKKSEEGVPFWCQHPLICSYYHEFEDSSITIEEIYKKINFQTIEAIIPFTLKNEKNIEEHPITQEFQIAFWALCTFIKKTSKHFDSCEKLCLDLARDALLEPSIMTNLFYCFICIARTIDFEDIDEKQKQVVKIKNTNLLKKGLAHLFYDRKLIFNTRQFCSIFLRNVLGADHSINLMNQLIGVTIQ